MPSSFYLLFFHLEHSPNSVSFTHCTKVLTLVPTSWCLSVCAHVCVCVSFCVSVKIEAPIEQGKALEQQQQQQQEIAGVVLLVC